MEIPEKKLKEFNLDDPEEILSNTMFLGNWKFTEKTRNDITTLILNEKHND